jgi:pimeloyl-ACP methyl ester carboxylesterase
MTGTDISRREAIGMATVVAGTAAISGGATRAAIVQTDVGALAPYGNGTIPPGIRARVIRDVNGLNMHVLEAGFVGQGRQLVVLLHGFPELAYSWRKVMLPLAADGYHVIAPDQRGFGRTTGWDDSYNADADEFRILNMVRDTEALVYALGYRNAAMIAGHDAGAPVASWAALIRPDIFRRLAILSSPFEGPPPVPFNTANGAPPPPRGVSDEELDAELAKLNPPRKYYQNYQRTPGANENMLHAPQGLHNFFRAYYFFKSADYSGNKPHPLKARTAGEMAQIPYYYVMLKDRGMAENVAPFMPPPEYIANCKWLTEPEVGVYATEYARTGFNGALQGYRVRRGGDAKNVAQMQTFWGRSVDVPSVYIAGKSDWGVYQTPGAVERMRSTACSKMVGFHLVDGAGHWVQQEQPEQVAAFLTAFLRSREG